MLDKLINWFKRFFVPDEEPEERDYEIVDVMELMREKRHLISKHPVHLKEHVLLNFIAGLRSSLEDFELASTTERSLETQAEVAIEMVYQIKAFALSAGLPWEKLWDAYAEDLRWLHSGSEDDTAVRYHLTTGEELRRAGYQHRAFTNQEGEVVDTFCWDNRRILEQDLLPSDVEL